MPSYDHLNTKQFSMVMPKDTGGTYPTWRGGKPMPMAWNHMKATIPYVELRPPRASN